MGEDMGERMRLSTWLTSLLTMAAALSAATGYTGRRFLIYCQYNG